MKITRIESWREALPLTRPYTIATRTVEAVTLFFVRLHTGTGLVGYGSAAPVVGVTGETDAACAKALDQIDRSFRGADLRHLGRLTQGLARAYPDTPAARAAVDMACLDAFTKHLGVPLVDFFGRCHDALPTSITIGIKPTQETLAEADEYLGRGFRCLKVKLGHDFAEDLDRLRQLRAHIGSGVLIRVDPNQGYTREETQRLLPWLDRLDLEFVEQPMPRGAETRALPEPLRDRLALDESLHGEADALALAAPPRAGGIFNIKLMKCGGPTAARRLATFAETAGIALMWGCMDESAVSIAAALHTAYASPATRYLDLDGSFDLARDLAEGGFRVQDGYLHLLDRPGLGVILEGNYG